MKQLRVYNGKLIIKFIIFILFLLLTLSIVNLHFSISSPLRSTVFPTPSPSPSPAPLLLPANLTEEERFILNPPSAEASRSAKQKHAQIVAKLAKVGNSLEIKNCQQTPLVLQVKQGSNLEIKNQDNVKREIIFDSDHYYELPANNSKTIKAEFNYGTGDYGYVCQGVGLVGFLHIVQ